MAWIELHQSLPTHRKTLALADELDIEPVQAVGHLSCLWLWALDNAPDGNLEGISDRTLARAAQWSADPAAFREGLANAGFVGNDEKIHDWDDYAGRLVERRQTERERSRQRRAAAQRPHDEPPPTNGRPTADHATTAGTVPNRTVPNRTSAPSGAAPRVEPAKTARVTKPSEGVNLAPIFEAFSALGLPRPAPFGAEAVAAGELLKHFEADTIAGCWQDITSGEWGDGFDQRKLSFAYLGRENRLGNWRAWKSGAVRTIQRSSPGKPSNPAVDEWVRSLEVS